MSTNQKGAGQDTSMAKFTVNVFLRKEHSDGKILIGRWLSDMTENQVIIGVKNY
jgi:hypothetical protein